jgi:hypothetical protein
MGNEKSYDKKGFASRYCVRKDTCCSVVQVVNLYIGWVLVWDIKV